MGAWGYGIFDNDLSLDWIDNVVSQERWEEVQLALSCITDAGESDDLANYQEWEALAAAEVIAAAAELPSPYLPNKAKEWLERRQPNMTRELFELALQAIDRIVAGTGLPKSWIRPEYAGGWLTQVVDLRYRLLTSIKARDFEHSERE